MVWSKPFELFCQSLQQHQLPAEATQPFTDTMLHGGSNLSAMCQGSLVVAGFEAERQIATSKVRLADIERFHGNIMAAHTSKCRGDPTAVNGSNEVVALSGGKAHQCPIAAMPMAPRIKVDYTFCGVQLFLTVMLVQAGFYGPLNPETALWCTVGSL